MGGGGGTGPDGPDRPQSGNGNGDENDGGVPPEKDDDFFLEGEPCVFDEQVTLASPKAGALSAVSVGDVLPVEQRQGSVVVVNHAGDVVGSIITPWVAELKECMDQGHDYEAEILSLNGAHCDVHLRNR